MERPIAPLNLKDRQLAQHLLRTALSILKEELQNTPSIIPSLQTTLGPAQSKLLLSAMGTAYGTSLLRGEITPPSTARLSSELSRVASGDANAIMGIVIRDVRAALFNHLNTIPAPDTPKPPGKPHQITQAASAYMQFCVGRLINLTQKSGQALR